MVTVMILSLNYEANNECGDLGMIEEDKNGTIDKNSIIGNWKIMIQESLLANILAKGISWPQQSFSLRESLDRRLNHQRNRLGYQVWQRLWDGK